MARLRVTNEWPARLTVALAGVGLLIALVGAVQGASDAAYDAAIAVVLVPVFVALVVLVEPSITVTAGLGLSMFSGNWDQLGIPIAADRALLFVGLVVVGAYLGITALAQEVDLKALVIPDYITDPTVGIHADRVRGPFADPASMGLGLFGCAVAAAMAAGRWRGHARQAALCVAVLCLAGIIFTVTRQAWLGAAVGSLVGLGATPRLRVYALPLIAGGALLVLGSFAAIPGLQERAGSRASDQQPVWDRLNSNRAGLAMVAARPVVGFGWGTFLADSEPYYKQAATYPLTTVPA